MDEHWTLCVVVNPGGIERRVGLKEGNLDEVVQDLPFPAILFFDSLKEYKLHNASVIARAVRDWLNYEWNEAFPKKQLKNPFSKKSMVLAGLEVPQQPNGYDCGVFVCRYAYGLLHLRQSSFSYRDAGVQEITNKMHQLPLFQNFIRRSGQFDFAPNEGDRMRCEMRILIERLSYRYESVNNVNKADTRLDVIEI